MMIAEPITELVNGSVPILAHLAFKGCAVSAYDLESSLFEAAGALKCQINMATPKVQFSAMAEGCLRAAFIGGDGKQVGILDFSDGGSMPEILTTVVED